MMYNPDDILYRPDGSILNPKKEPFNRADRPITLYEWRWTKQFPFYQKVPIVYELIGNMWLEKNLMEVTEKQYSWEKMIHFYQFLQLILGSLMINRLKY